MLTTIKRRRLVNRATQDAYHRRLTWQKVAQIEGIEACRRTLFKAFRNEGYFRRKATKKPYLTQAHKDKRVAWAEEHKNWTLADWRHVDWTDECKVCLGGFGHVWITRTAEERLDSSCCVPKFRKQPGLMIHGAISGISKGPLTIFEPGTKVNSEIYSLQVLPKVHQHIISMEKELGIGGGILMEDGASIHTSNLTSSWHRLWGFVKMEWPANSPDLNPIENVWRKLKYRLNRRLPRNLDELYQALIEEWDRLSLDDYEKYINEMHERCEAVIQAKGGHTKW